MKTIKEWLEQLPEPYRKQALQNLDPAETHTLREDMSSALDIAFLWKPSPEGWRYWEELAHEYANKPKPVTNALSAIHAISLKLGFPAEYIVAVKPWTNAPLDKWEYQLKDNLEWIFINLSNS